MTNKPPYLPPKDLPGASLRQNRPPGQPPRQWMTVLATMVITAIIAIAVMFAVNPPRTVEVQLTALAAATMTAVYTPPPSPTPTPVDSDGDTIPDSRDNCILVSNPQQEDMDGDKVGDGCDNDADGDGIPQDGDNCSFIADTNQTDIDNDGQGDICDSDDDGDEVPDALDNCPLAANREQSDVDGDGQGDACDDSFDLSGLNIAPEHTAPLYIGSLNNDVILLARYARGITPAAGASLQWMATAGTFRLPEQTCVESGSGQFIMPATEARIRFCPPETLSALLITVREINSAGRAIGSGGQVMLDARQDSLIMNLQLAGTLNLSSEPADAPPSRCYLSVDITGVNLESEAIPLALTVQTANSADTGRAYRVHVTLPPGLLFIARNNDCMLVTANPLDGSGEFTAAINQPYTLFYVPGQNLRDMRLSLTAMANSTDFDIPPLMKALRPLRLRTMNGEAVARLDNGDRTLLTGITADKAWARVRVTGDDRDLWLNLAQTPVSGLIIGSTLGIPLVEPPTYAGTTGGG